MQVCVGNGCNLQPFSIATGGLDIAADSTVNPMSCKAQRSTKAKLKASSSLLGEGTKNLGNSQELSPGCLLGLQACLLSCLIKDQYDATAM